MGCCKDVRTETTGVQKKIVVKVDMLCSKCKKKVMQLIAGIGGINSIILDASKNLATITGDADPCEIMRKMRKFRRSAEIVSIGPPKEEKKDCYPCMPSTCQGCQVWYEIEEDNRSCTIM